MHTLGANTWIWTSPLTDAWLAEFAPRIREWGFDVMESPVDEFLKAGGGCRCLTLALDVTLS